MLYLKELVPVRKHGQALNKTRIEDQTGLPCLVFKVLSRVFKSCDAELVPRSSLKNSLQSTSLDVSGVVRILAEDKFGAEPKVNSEVQGTL